MQVLEGYGSVAYPVELVPWKMLLEFSKLSSNCFKSDDLVISFGLAVMQVPIIHCRSFPELFSFY